MVDAVGIHVPLDRRRTKPGCTVGSNSKCTMAVARISMDNIGCALVPETIQLHFVRTLPLFSAFGSRESTLYMLPNSPVQHSEYMVKGEVRQVVKAQQQNAHCYRNTEGLCLFSSAPQMCVLRAIQCNFKMHPKCRRVQYNVLNNVMMEQSGIQL